MDAIAIICCAGVVIWLVILIFAYCAIRLGASSDDVFNRRG